MSEELKPCPFCGEADLLGFEQNKQGWVVVACKNCGASGSNGRSTTEIEAAAFWNRRAQPAAQAVPEGWKLVPVEPTTEMLRAGVDVAVGALPIYRAMLDAAPTPPAGEVRTVPDGLLDRIESAIKRITDNHAPRRIPADPTDVDLVLAECIAFLEGRWPPFWIDAAQLPDAPAQEVQS